MSKKTTIIASIIGAILILLIVASVFVFNNNSNGQANYSAKKTDTSDSENEENLNNTDDSSSDDTSSEEQKVPENVATEEPPKPTLVPVEEELASFSTKILSYDQARQTNIQITCNAITNTTVENGETFSFCSTVGPSTTAKGYKKADIFDADGNKKKGLGGGNCQISTTLYNAALATPGIKIVERHPHSNYVPYIEKGKDAAVAYGSYDLKFRNETGNTIKLKAETNSEVVSTAIVKITYQEQ